MQSLTLNLLILTVILSRHSVEIILTPKDFYAFCWCPKPKHCPVMQKYEKVIKKYEQAAVVYAK